MHSFHPVFSKMNLSSRKFSSDGKSTNNGLKNTRFLFRSWIILTGGEFKYATICHMQNHRQELEVYFK